MSNKKTAIMGGTFDPVHVGHMSFAREILEKACIDELVFMPAKLQPFKLDVRMSSFEDRAAMLALACRKIPGASVSVMENELPGVSYTYRTLEEYRKASGCSDLYFVTGADSYVKLDTWMNHEKLLSDNSFIVGVRPGYSDEEIYEKMAEYEEKYKTRTVIIENTPVDMSATQIREDISAGRSIAGKVCADVAEYIYTHGLYK